LGERTRAEVGVFGRRAPKLDSIGTFNADTVFQFTLQHEVGPSSNTDFCFTFVGSVRSSGFQFLESLKAVSVRKMEIERRK
jgi:hypothetical protein